MTDNTNTTQTKTAAQLMKEAAARAQQAKAPEIKDSDAEAAAMKTTSTPEAAGQAPIEKMESIDQFPQLYQMPSAPATVIFKNPKTRRIYKRIFPDGVAKADNVHEHRKLEEMVENYCCYYFRGTKAQSAQQKMPEPIVPVQVIE